MVTLSAVTLLANGLTISLALGFLIITLWHDARKELNQFFAVFLFMVTLWNIGSLLVQVALLLSEVNPLIVSLAVSVMSFGFTGASVAIYILTTILAGVRIRRLKTLAFGILILVVMYQVFLIVIKTTPIDDNVNQVFTQKLHPLFIIFYMFFDGITLYMLWHYRRRIRSRGLRTGITLFLVGQSLTFINPDLIVASFSTTVSSIGALISCFAILQQEIITPLTERSSQVETMHRVSLAITSQISLDTVLKEIATQAAGWLNADGVGIFLVKEYKIVLETVYGLPHQLIYTEVMFGKGVSGTVAQSHQSIFLENYGRDWKGIEDFPLARETFGSVICVPLDYGGSTIGVLLVVSGRQGRLFGVEDVYLLELLGSQAAVAIAHSRLFTEQKALTSEVETAHSQLETVLTSTENPVLAINRQFKLIFANPAAQKLFSIPPDFQDSLVIDMLPHEAFPLNRQEVLQGLRRKSGYAYEVSLNDKVYLCHLAILGRPRIAGWVAVLNDVTQLKELDRMKSEMVRMASHDLKNPLMGAMAYLDLLNEDLEDNPNPEVHEALMVVERQLGRMNRIIRGVLDLERLKTITPVTELCDPSRIVKNCVDELTYLIEDKHVKLEVRVEENLLDFWCDRDQFERALVNLIENAVKFTLVEGWVRIAVYQSNSDLIFEVRDNGVGIPLELQVKVFERFFRGRQKGIEHVSGSGLGLSLVKTIVENHHGRLWLESEENSGTAFFISIPDISYSH